MTDRYAERGSGAATDPSLAADSPSPRGCERFVDHLDLVCRRRIVRVDLRGVQVGVPEKLLDRAKRLSRGRQACRERVPQVVEPDLPYPGIAASSP